MMLQSFKIPSKTLSPQPKSIVSQVLQSPRFGDCFVVQNLPERLFKNPNNHVTIAYEHSSLLRQGRDFYFVTNHRFFKTPSTVLSDMTQLTDTFVSNYSYSDLKDPENVRQALKKVFSIFVSQIMVGKITPSFNLPLSQTSSSSSLSLPSKRSEQDAQETFILDASSLNL
jgi:hypothetical protein